MKAILIFHISEVSGHRKAAEAIRDALEYRDPLNIRIVNVDALRFFHPYAHNLINRAYLGVIRTVPFVWKTLYDKASVARALAPIKAAIHTNKMKAMRRIFNELNPAAIVCTQAFPCGIAADFKKEFGVKTPLIGVVTDFHPHRFWVYDEVDFYTVATEEAQRTLVSLGVSPERIKITGIPISLHFLHFDRDRERIGMKIGLSPEVPTILIMGGGSGLGPIEEVVRQLDRLPQNFQMAVVCGKNHALFNTLTAARPALKKKTAVFAYVEFINELMSFSDILITKPGGITVSEALALNVALIIINPIPGQEENNTQVLLRETVALKADCVEDVVGFVKGFIEDAPYLHSFKQRGMRLAKPDSSLKIAELVLHASQCSLL